MSGRIDLFVNYPDCVEFRDWKDDVNDEFLKE